MIAGIGDKQQETVALRAPVARLASKPEPAVEEQAAEPAVASGGTDGTGGPYFSPVVRIDPESQRTIITFRDVGTGKVQIQYPSERQLEAYRNSQRQRKEQEVAAELERVFGSRHSETATSGVLPRSGVEGSEGEGRIASGRDEQPAPAFAAGFAATMAGAGMAGAGRVAPPRLAAISA